MGKKNTIEDLMKKIIKTESCWLWTGLKGYNGYGRVRWNGREVYVHRLIYEQLKTSIPSNLFCDHICKVRECCNPEHIDIVTQKENNNRSMRKRDLKTGRYL
jgi:hypothetical protein